MNCSQGCEVRRTFSATLEAIEEFFLEFRTKCTCLLGRPEAFTAELLLREALTNAVQHGCQCNAAKRVQCGVRIRRGRLTIAVSDEGAGFDWRTAWERRPSDTAASGRGMEIFRQYATRVRFRDKGNGLALWKRLGTGK